MRRVEDLRFLAAILYRHRSQAKRTLRRTSLHQRLRTDAFMMKMISGAILLLMLMTGVNPFISKQI